MNPQSAQPQSVQNGVLVITKEGPQRETIRKNLSQQGGFKVSFISQLQNANIVLHELRPAILLHDWDAFDKDQSCLFHQMLAKMADFSSLIRIVYAHKISPNLLALSADTGIDRIITLTNLKLNIVEEINMARSAVSSLNEIQAMMRAIHNDMHTYSQNELDKIVAEVYERYPYDAIVKIEYGNLCFRKHRFAKALTIAEELLNQNKNNVRAMSLISRIHMKQQKYDEALKILEYANILSPKNTKRLILLGDICLRKGNRKKARGYYQEAYDCQPSDDEVITALANFEIGEDNQNAALDLFKKTMSEEEIAGILNNLGIKAVREHRYEEAMKFYKLAINALHTNRFIPQIYFNMALAQRRSRNFNTALDYLQKALIYDPNFRKATKQIKEIEKIKSGNSLEDNN